jgi:hypothetical protein
VGFYPFFPAAGGGGGSPTGPAGGDLTGTYPAPQVDLIGGLATSGQYVRGNGTTVALSAIQAGDVPVLNQSTTGNAATATSAAACTGNSATATTATTAGACSGNAATATNLAGGATFPDYVAPAAAEALTGAATIAVNAATANDMTLTLTASTWTMGVPASPVPWQTIRFHVSSGTGGFTLAWNAVYDFGAAGTPTLSAAASKTDVVGFIYNPTLAKWCYLGSALGN